MHKRLTICDTETGWQNPMYDWLRRQFPLSSQRHRQRWRGCWLFCFSRLERAHGRKLQAQIESFRSSRVSHPYLVGFCFYPFWGLFSPASPWHGTPRFFFDACPGFWLFIYLFFLLLFALHVEQHGTNGLSK
jgi:hypothetical protein